MPVRFSFIVPVYNSTPWLEECVDSLLAQEEKDHEILLIDDGSSDGSGPLCDRLAEKDPRIRTFHKENGGAASARNLGIEQACGRWLLFIDGDDTITPDCLRRLAPFLTEEACLPIFGMAFDFWRGGVLRRSDRRSCAFEGRYAAQELAEKLSAFFEDNVLSSACNKAFSAALIRENGLRFPEGMTLYEDFTFVLAYLLHADAICCIPLPLYHYRNLEEADHFTRRVLDPDRLRRNASRLNRALLDFGASYHAPKPAASVAAELSMQLLSQHLLAVRTGEAELRRSLSDFCAEPSFRAVLAEAPELSADSRTLLTEIEQEQFRSIRRRYRRRRWKRALRKRVKAVLRC